MISCLPYTPTQHTLPSFLVIDFSRRARAVYETAQKQLVDSADNVPEGSFQHIYSKENPKYPLDIFDRLNSDQIKRLSNVLNIQSGIKFDSVLGSGGFGCVFSGMKGGDYIAVKFEVLEGSEFSALEREAQVYSQFGPSNRVDDIPLPKTINAISPSAGKNCHFFASVPINPGVFTVNVMCMEYLDIGKVLNIWRDGKAKLADHLEVTAYLRYLILDVLHAMLYLVHKGIANRDFKLPHHVGYRPDSEQLVVFDFGLGEVKGICYGNPEPSIPPNRKQQSISAGIVAASTTRIEPRFGRKRPGTRGYRAPFLANTQDLGHFTDIWSAAASILKLFRKCPRDTEGSQAYEASLLLVVRKKDFQEFLKFALEGRNVGEMKDSCRRLLELAYSLFQSTPFDGHAVPSPEDALTAALFSEFALCSVFEKQEMETILRNEGIVIRGKILPSGKIQRPVLLILDIFGLMVLTIFKCEIGDQAGEYCGRVRSWSPNKWSRESFSMHAVRVEAVKILDGAIRKDLPLEVLIKAGVGSMFMSSRTDPSVSKSGNVNLIERLKGRRSLQIEGIPLESIPMNFREKVNECTVITWDYNWAQAQSGIGMSEVQIKKAMGNNSRGCISAIEARWRPRVMDHKERILREGVFSDATEPFPESCDGDDKTELCTLFGDCFCDSASINPVRSLDCSSFMPFEPDFRPRKGHVWVVPKKISDDERSKLTFVADAKDFREGFHASQNKCGTALVQGLDRIFRDEWNAALSVVKELADEHCVHDVFIYAGDRPHVLNAGRKRKKLGYIGEFENAPATYMKKTMAFILPEYKVAIGKRVRESEKPEVEQCELIREIPPPIEELGEVQSEHTDAAVLNPDNLDGCMDILRANLQAVLNSQGPLSFFYPFTSGYCLIVFPTAHQPAIECLKNFARHYEPAKKAFFTSNVHANNGDWKAAWCGFTVNRLRKLFPGQCFDPVCIHVDLGEVLVISSYLPHCGVPVEGIRGFVAATHKVPMLFKFNVHILISFDLCCWQDSNFTFLHDTSEIIRASFCFGGMNALMTSIPQARRRIS